MFGFTAVLSWTSSIHTYLGIEDLTQLKWATALDLNVERSTRVDPRVQDLCTCGYACDEDKYHHFKIRRYWIHRQALRCSCFNQVKWRGDWWLHLVPVLLSVQDREDCEWSKQRTWMRSGTVQERLAITSVMSSLDDSHLCCWNKDYQFFPLEVYQPRGGGK